MLESLKIIIYMEKVHINGLMEENMWVIGKITKWMEMEYLFGQMEENT
jgi:hypothetical protein